MTNRNKISLAASTIFGLISSTLCATDLKDLVAPTAAAVKVVGDCKFTEGPAFSPKGFLLFSDIPNSRIVRVEADGQSNDFLKPSGGANGLVFDGSGHLYACQGQARRVVKIAIQDGKIETLCDQYQSGVEYQILIDVDVNECDEELTLGIYRIVEQGIINAITHGPASKVKICIQKSDSETYLLEISDNGPGAYNPKPGTGSVIIDAWCSILDGVKEIESEPDNGFTLRVRIPAKR